MPTRHEDEAEIRLQIDRMVEAIRTHDLEAFKHVYAEDIVSFDVQPPLQHLGSEAKRKNWLDAFTAFQQPLDYEVHDLTITVGDDLAFGHSLNRLSGKMRNGTATSGMWVRWTGCFRKVDGTWLITHDHVSAPLDFESGKSVVDLEP